VIAQLVQIAGSLLVLAAFAAAQFGRVGTNSLSYLVANAVGSGVLAVLAFLEQQWGFLILEGSWSLVSLFGLARLVLRRRSAPVGDSDPGGGADAAGSPG